MGGDDFSAYLAEAPGCYAFIGAGGEFPHHHPRFVIDERALAIGTRLHVDVALRRSRCSHEAASRSPSGEDVLADLRRRLDATRWPDEAPDAVRARARAASGAVARGVLALVYDWRAAEAELNAFEQFVVDGVHSIAEGDGPPLLLMHGWPSSVWEFHRLIPLLRDATCASSCRRCRATGSRSPAGGAPGSSTCADALHALMGTARALAVPRRRRRLGRAHRRPARVRLSGRGPGAAPVHDAAAPARDRGRSRRPSRAPRLSTGPRRRAATSHIQGTQPQTLAYGLQDSPVGLMSWIAEKFDPWTDSRGVPTTTC